MEERKRTERERTERRESGGVKRNEGERRWCRVKRNGGNMVIL